MRNFLTFILILSVIPIRAQTMIDSTELKLLDEYFLIVRSSWNHISGNSHMLHSPNVLPTKEFGDTITLKNDNSFLQLPSDTTRLILLDNIDRFVNLNKGTKLLFRKSYVHNQFNPSFDMVTINLDSNMLVEINFDDLFADQYGYKELIHRKNYRLKRIMDSEKMFEQKIERLANKSNLSREELFKVLAEEYYELTGIPLF